MNAVLRQVFKNAISSKKEMEFQEFINSLFLTVYGTDFICVKQKTDRGCDGIIKKENAVLAVYAPEKYSLRDFRNKIGSDFEGYNKNWSKNYPNWRVIYNGNGAITADGIKFLSSLKNDVELFQIDNLLEIIEKSSWSDIKKIASFLNIDSSYIVIDVLEEIVDDLGREEKERFVEYKEPVYFPKKVEINFSEEDRETILSEYSEYILFFPVLEKVLGENEGRLNDLKSKIISGYIKYGGECKIKMEELTKEYASRRSNDDYYRKMIRVVLIYVFEQCLIGRKTQTEKQYA